MNNIAKYLTNSMLGVAALLGGASPVWAQVPLGAAAGFSVLGGSAVTCTSGLVSGNTGLFPGSAFTNTLCTFIGETPPANNAVAALARTDFLAAYAALRKQSKECTVLPGNLADQNLAPGVYCLDSVAKTGNLTLNGPVNGEWTFLVNGALTGTNFSVAMAGGGKPCNVFWATNAGVTMTTSSLKGNILAGDAIDGSITLTGGNLVGSVLANVAMTITGTSIISCGAL